MSTEMLDTQPPGRRERKKLATRQALQDAALRLVADRGLEQVTVEDISEAADVATRTFFNYFSSKEEALLGDAPEKVATVHRLVADRPATESPLEAVHQVLRELALQQAQRREELLLRQRVIERHPGLLARQLGMYASFERALAAAVAERPGVPAADALSARVMATAAVAAARAAVSLWMAEEGRRPLLAMIDAAFLHLRELGSPPPDPSNDPSNRTPT
jgi:AcrR family transcriptional regulator